MSSKTNIILTPVYNDWHSFIGLMCDVDKCAGDLKEVSIDAIAIDDGSTESLCSVTNETDKYKHIREISVLHFARNLDHQKAIALGIAYINSNVLQSIAYFCLNQYQQLARSQAGHTYIAMGRSPHCLWIWQIDFGNLGKR